MRQVQLCQVLHWMLLQQPQLWQLSRLRRRTILACFKTQLLRVRPVNNPMPQAIYQPVGPLRPLARAQRALAQHRHRRLKRPSHPLVNPERDSLPSRKHLAVRAVPRQLGTPRATLAPCRAQRGPSLLRARPAARQLPAPYSKGQVDQARQAQRRPQRRLLRLQPPVPAVRASRQLLRPLRPLLAQVARLRRPRPVSLARAALRGPRQRRVLLLRPQPLPRVPQLQAALARPQGPEPLLEGRRRPALRPPQGKLQVVLVAHRHPVQRQRRALAPQPPGSRPQTCQGPLQLPKLPPPALPHQPAPHPRPQHRPQALARQQARPPEAHRRQQEQQPVP